MEYGPDLPDKNSRMENTPEGLSGAGDSDAKPKNRKRFTTRLGEVAAGNKEAKPPTQEREDTTPDKPTRLEELFETKEPDINAKEHEAEPKLPENLEELSDEELALVLTELVEAREEALQAEAADMPADSPEEAAMLANAQFIDKVAEKLEAHEPMDGAVLDDVVHEVIDELEITPPEEEMPKADESDPLGPNYFPNLLRTSPLDDSPESVMARGAGMPPPPRSPAARAAAQNSIPTPINVPFGHAESSSRPTTPEGNKYQRGTDLLIGGVIGYMIGRRRGRIKTEERLIPVQKSLEKKVDDLQEKLAIGEKKIRTLTTEKIAREGEDARKAVVEKVEARAHAKFEARQTAKAEAAEAAQTERVRQPGEQIPEIIAAVLPIRSGVDVARPESYPSMPQRPDVQSIASGAEHQLTDEQLMRVAEKVTVEGTTAKALYEQGRLSREDLRQVSREFVKGHGGHEKLLVEKLRPRRAESMEAMPKENGSQSAQAAGAAGGTALRQGYVPQQQLTPANHESAVDNLIAQHTMQDQQERSHHNAMWIFFAVVIVGLATLFLVF